MVHPLENQENKQGHIPDEVELLFQMKRIRLIEEAIGTKYSEWKMRCPVHLSIGQEGVAATVGFLLHRDDYAVSGHRAHAHYLGKGGSLKRMIAEIYGKKTGCSAGKGGSMHLIDQSVGFMGSTAIVGGTIPIGVGLAYAIRLKKTQQISCIFLGDGAIEEGVFYEAANFAVLKNLPVLFICENNFYSVYSPLSVRQPEGRQICDVAKGIGLESHTGDGNKSEDLLRLTSQAVTRVREASGPQFLEFTTYRWREHCGPNFDNHIGYRSETEFLDWKVKDPIKVLEEKLKISNEEIQLIEDRIKMEIEEAFRFAEESPFPEPKDAFTHLYADSL